jgi:CheY-like chemotaxis protein
MNGQESYQSFFRELRRRKVVRVVVVYAVVAYTMIEISKNFADILELPSWTPRLVVLMLALGFPLAVILAWAYELTPEGLRRTESPPEEPARPALASAAGGTGRTVASRRPGPRRDPGRLTTGEMRALAVPDAAQLRRATLASLRHELRTPLTAVVGYSEMLLEDARPEQAPPLREILASGRRVLGIVDELVRPGMAGEEITDEDVAEMRRRIRAELPEPVGQLVAVAKGTLATAQAAGDFQVVPDLERITEAAGRLQTLVETDPSVLGLDHAAPAGGDQTRDVAARVIAAFPSRAGGNGAETLPKHGQILVVDDNEDNRDLLSRQLARQGFSVSLAAHGEGALEALRGQDFDLVLLDVLMPGLDGIEVLEQMQQDPSTAEVPVIMTSALDEIDGVVRCIEQGAVDYLTKPFDPVLLQARVSATLDLHRLRAQQRRARQELDEEIAWSGRLIRSLVPDPLVERVREGRGTLVESHDSVTALVLTIQGLGTFAARHGAPALGAWMAETVATLDGIVHTFPVEAYWEAGATLVASTGTVPTRPDETSALAELALRLAEASASRCEAAEPVRVGIGIHTGPTVAGLIDGERVAFGLWGEAADVARELAWQCPDATVQVSPAAYATLHGAFTFEARGMIETSSRSHMRVYALLGRPVPAGPES